MKGISIIGGDLRQLTLFDELLKEGRKARLFGFSELAERSDQSMKKLEIGDDIVILPMPVSVDGETVNSVYDKNPVRLDYLLSRLTSANTVFGGQPGKTFFKALMEKGVKFYDYLDSEELAVKNAVPTAEGAIAIAINETPHTLHGSRCAVLGGGRIGKALSSRLKALNAEVTVFARSCDELAASYTLGADTFILSELCDKISGFDIIFNTAPSMLLNFEILKRIKHDALIIDLASKPGGVDFAKALELNAKVIWALSLPGKTAPVTSGKIIKDTILNIIAREEV